ncbi:hypothetical protein [Yinghuangia seranimata]|uniref:hypothetical protein n=1 Tax=Yinghuangia seranimata TaxID=408067 RepID=UPI00248C8549|nr:hypothetical protein [Yinghuangia seranimata]MDI2128780.1 hypothetical protein [Yinghuangia seranimata]
MNTSTIVHEAYSFVCLSCGHGWERAYEIHHVTGLHGERVCHYYADGDRVPSPFSRPSCEHCDGVRLRILPAGRVASVTPPPPPSPSTGAAPPSSTGRHWHLRLSRH